MAAFKEYSKFDGLGLAHLIKQKIVTPKEVLDAAIEKIELENPKLNAVICKLYSQAEKTIQSDIPDGLFKGVPFPLKDLIAECEGTPLHYGSRFASHWISPGDSELIRRYKNAGLVIIGKTNTPEFGLCPVTEPELYGPTRNPWNLEKTCGGSSGGSAAAVASGMVPIAHGGDGAGSIRIPAAYCGLFGFKPSRGRTPVGPKFLRLWMGMVVEHVMTRSVRDSAAMLDVAAGAEIGSPISLNKPDKSFLESIATPPQPLRIGMTDLPFFNGTVTHEYADALKKAAKLCEELGHKVESIQLQINIDDIQKAFTIVMLAEVTTDINAIARWMGKKVSYKELEINTAIAYKAGNCFSAADFDWAIYVLDNATKQCAELFEKYDVLMTPTMPSPAPDIGALKLKSYEKIISEIMLYMPKGPWLNKLIAEGSKKIFAMTSFTMLFNISGQPAMSVPLFCDSNNMPIGIQFAGKFADDVTLLKLAKQLEEAKPWCS